MKFMKNGKLLIISLIFLFLFAPLVKADGIAITTGVDFSFHALHGEHTQIAAINYEDGKEKLIIAIKIDQIKNNEVIWIVPIPSKPEDVKINILKNFPTFRGIDIKTLGEGPLFSEETKAMIILSQIWSIPYGIFSLWVGAMSIRLMPSQYGVEVYTQIEKEGILTQVVTAETSEGLVNYLRSKGLNVSDISIPILNDYIGKEYSFVVSWLTGTGKSDKYTVPAIFVEFPTDKIFYPLKPTSIYGERGIPVIIYIVGFVKPEFYNDIKDYARYKYFYVGSPPQNWPDEFYKKERLEKGLFYTRINIGYEEGIELYYEKDLKTPPAEKFTEDLWLEKLEKTPPEVERGMFKHMLQSNSIFIAFFIFVISSIFSSLIAGKIFFKDTGILKLSVIGLTNISTLIGLVVGTYVIIEENKKENRWKFIFAFSLIFLFLNLFVLIPLGNFLFYLI